MRGILWRWLFFFGTILWVSLCLADNHQKYLHMNFEQTLKNMEIKVEPLVPQFYQIVPQQKKLQPPTPALTFWKFLSIVFSVSAIFIIKRLSNFRKKSLPVASCSDFDLIRAPYGSFITKIPPINNNNVPVYHQEFQVRRLKTNLNAGDTKPTALCGVKIVQKKLEDLENNIATLKRRISNNSANNCANSASDSIKNSSEQKPNESTPGPVVSNPDTQSSTLSFYLNQTKESKIGKEILFNHSRPPIPIPFELKTDSNDITSKIPSVTKIPSMIHTPEKKPTSEKSNRKSATNCSSKEVKLNRNSLELDADIISLKELKDSMSGNILPIHFEETCVKDDPSQDDLNSTSLSSKRTSCSRKSRTEYLLSESKTNTISSRKTHNTSIKTFPMDGTSTTKLTDTNSTSSTLTSIKKKRYLKSMKIRKKDQIDFNPISKTIATYLAPNYPISLPHLRHKHDSYAAINKKKNHHMKTAKMAAYDQVSVCSSNESSDSIDKFVAKVMKPDSDVTIIKNNSEDSSIASTSISSLTASTSTFISENHKYPSVSNSFRSIRSILPLPHTKVPSNFFSLRNSRNIPAGADPLSSGESLIEKSVSKYGSNLAIHSLAMNYLQTLEEKKYKGDNQDKVYDTSSEFSTTKSVLENYNSKTKDRSVASSHILEDKYWLLHW